VFIELDNGSLRTVLLNISVLSANETRLEILFLNNIVMLNVNTWIVIIYYSKRKLPVFLFHKLNIFQI